MTKTVAIIEDEPFIVEALEFLLQREGFAVKIHNSGEDAVQFIATTKPDMVILDNMLPVINGMQILEIVRADPDLSALPILMLTAKGQRKDRFAAEAAGASQFMTKPFANSELIAAVHHLVGS